MKRLNEIKGEVVLAVLGIIAAITIGLYLLEGVLANMP